MDHYEKTVFFKGVTLHMTEVILNVLGTAQDAGLPHPNCFCENCLEAIENLGFKRLAASLAIVLPETNSWHLIDATPDLKEQMMNLQMKYKMQGQLMETIFLTHAHLGHYPGLLFLGREAIGAKNIPLFAGSQMQNLLKKQAPWHLLTDLENIKLQQLNDGQTVNLASAVSITPIEVLHRNEFSETFGFWIQGPNKKVLYIPDIDQWTEWNQDIYDVCQKADICLLDSTFYSTDDLEKIGRSYGEIPHPLMTETMERLQDLTGQTDIYFTHLNHSNPTLNSNRIIREKIEAKGFYIAEEMMTFTL